MGDYTRRLAEELTTLGHECAIVALQDSFVDHPTEMRVGLRHLRLPSFGWLNSKAGREFVRSFKANWLSLQFVPYAYSPRGIIPSMLGNLLKHAHSAPIHVMFHEIWIGEAQVAPLKHRWMGWLQRNRIRRLTRHLRPAVVHTHTPLYQHLLRGIRVDARLLPLFGNIPLASPDPTWLARHFLPAAHRDQWCVFVIFGTIHPEWDGVDFQRRAVAAVQAAGKRCLFISIGRPGAAGEKTLERLREGESDLWHNLNLGEQPEHEVSQALWAADAGVSAVPPEYLPKSGTAAAMREHGLPIVAMRPMNRYPNCPPEVLAAEAGQVGADINLGAWSKTAPGSFLPAVADQFLHDLSRA